MATRDEATQNSPDRNGIGSPSERGTPRRTPLLSAVLGTCVLIGYGCQNTATQAVQTAAPAEPQGAPQKEVPPLPVGPVPASNDELASDTPTRKDVNRSTESSTASAAPDGTARAAIRGARRAQLAQTLAQEPGWNLYESEHYFVASPLSDPLLIEGAKRRLDAMRRQLERDFQPQGALALTGATLVRILPDRAGFVDWGGQAGSSAFWLSEQRTLICYDAGDNLERERETWPALQHVLVHEYFGQVLGIREVPPWLLYGVATKYASLRLEGTGVSEHWAPPAAAMLDGPLREVLAGAGPMPLARLLTFDTEEFLGVNEFGSTAYRNLILAGGFVRFAEADGAQSEAMPGDFLKRYVSGLQAGKARPTALSEALQGADLGALDQAWRSWMEARSGRALLPAGG